MPQYVQPQLPGVGAPEWRQGELFSPRNTTLHPTTGDVLSESGFVIPEPRFPDKGPEKEPHQMSPVEFAAHPHAVFHATIKQEPNLRHPHMHLGTEDSALDRHIAVARYETGQRTAQVHTFWHDPKNSTGLIHEDEGDHSITGHTTDEPSEYYMNKVEDPGTLSVWVHNPAHLKSQADFVKRAISDGKIGEVHPETIKQYRQGTLGRRTQPIDDTLESRGNRVDELWQVNSANPDRFKRAMAEVDSTLPGMSHQEMADAQNPNGLHNSHDAQINRGDDIRKALGMKNNPDKSSHGPRIGVRGIPDRFADEGQLDAWGW